MTIGSNENAIRRPKALELTLIALMAAVTSVCAWISIPTAIPFTLQTFAVFATISLLGGRDGLFSILIYLFIGAIGIPVFAGFKGGIGIVLGPTGGYLVGFIFVALIYWLLTKLLGDKLYIQIIAMVIGLAVLYLFGTLWFMFVYTGGSSMSFTAVLGICVIPFIIPDLIKMGLGIAISATLKKRLNLNF